jgi:hypothetical protein
MRARNAKVARPGVGSIFGQQDSAIANSGRPENRPDPFEVARPVDAADAKGPSDFSGRPVVAEEVSLPEKTPDPGDELLYPDDSTSSQTLEDQVVIAKREQDKLLLKARAGSSGVGSIFGQQDSAIANSSRPENRPDPVEVARPIGVAAKKPSDFSGQPVLAKQVQPPEKTAGPGDPYAAYKPRKRGPSDPVTNGPHYVKPTTWPQPPPGKQWLQDPEFLWDLGMELHGRPIQPSLVITYQQFPPPRRGETMRHAW